MWMIRSKITVFYCNFEVNRFRQYNHKGLNYRLFKLKDKTGLIKELGFIPSIIFRLYLRFRLTVFLGWSTVGIEL